VKLEYKTLKEKMKEINKKDAQFYGNMFSKMKKLDSLDNNVSDPSLLILLTHFYFCTLHYQNSFLEVHTIQVDVILSLGV
jgi:hypothetical protein